MLPNARDYEVLVETRRAEVETLLEENQKGRDTLPSSTDAKRKPLASVAFGNIRSLLRKIGL
ncbi:hypothetical protein [Cohnella yongneupensis]|uniref:Uncharacterized protein n=1 Tax=Cohnella yongneupensis TaxID=425006 RepID=A0ABW0R4L6_9BACL